MGPMSELPPVLAIDPGNTASGWCLIDPDTLRPLGCGKDLNDRLIEVVHDYAVTHASAGRIACEMIASYGMPVGAEIFHTCLWIGRVVQVAADMGTPVRLVYRREVKLHLCESPRARDGNVTAALVDRFARGPNRGKGTKAAPGWFYGFAGDIWSAYAVGVTAIETAGQEWVARRGRARVGRPC